MSTRLLENGGLIGYTPEFRTDLYRLDPIYVGGAQATNNATSTTTIQFSTLSGGVGGVTTGDVVIVTVGLSGSTDYTMALNTTGYTKLYDLFVNGTQNSDNNFSVFYKVMGATSDTSVAQTGYYSGGGHVISVQVWRNIDTTNPIAGSNTATATANTTSVTPATLTSTYARSPIITSTVITHTNGSLTFSANSGYDFRSVGVNTTADATGGIAYLYTSSAGQSIAPSNWTVSASAGGGSATASVTLELKPLSATSVRKNSGMWDLSSTASRTFSTSFENPALSEWTSVSASTLTATGAKAHRGIYSVQTNLTVDTDGVYTPLKASFTRDFTAEWWGLTRPCSIYLLDSSGQGYGLRVLGSTLEVRRKPNFTTAGTVLGTAGNYTATTGWMRVTFVANLDNTFTGTIYDASGFVLGTVTSPVDTTYTGPFTLVLLNASGGTTVSYYDDLRIRKNG